MMETMAEILETSPESVNENAGPAMEEWVLGILQQQRLHTLDQLGLLLPAANWAQLFLAVDRLSRSGAITLRSNGQGQYLLSAKGHQPEGVQRCRAK
ncbi:MAG: hypothetical protein ACREJU_09805 [Nitrospiraceae bacterium]